MDKGPNDDIAAIAQRAVGEIIVANNAKLDAAILEFLGFTLEEAKADAKANPDKYEIQHHNGDSGLDHVIFLNKETKQGVLLRVTNMRYGEPEPYVAE